MTTPSAAPLLVSVLDRVRVICLDSGMFDDVQATDRVVAASAKDSAAPAEYALEVDGDAIWALLRTEDRWLSQSIEQDLVHTGDKLDELLEEELVDLGEQPGGRAPFEHFRDERKRFVFRFLTPFAASAASKQDAERMARWLLALEATFRPLGDMEADDDE